MSGKLSIEKTSDFWASHCRPFQGLKTHPPSLPPPVPPPHTHTHTQRQVSACSTLYVLKSEQSKSTFQSLLSPFHHASREQRIRDVYQLVMAGFIPFSRSRWHQEASSDRCVRYMQLALKSSENKNNRKETLRSFSKSSSRTI